MAFRVVLAPFLHLLVQVRSFATWNITEMRERLGMAPSCTEATDADWQNLNLDLGKVCEEQIGCGGVTDFEVNPHDGYGFDACITQGEVEFQGLEPTQGTKQVDQQEACNNLDGKVTQTITLNGADASTLSVATTSTSSFSEEIDVEIEIPDALKVTSKTTFGFSSSTTASQSDSSSRGYSNSVQADIPPHDCVCAKEQMKTLVYDSTFTVPVCLSGFFRCNWYWQCKGHHWWYINFAGVFTQDELCYSINGKARSNQDISGSAVADPGKCPQKDGIIV